MARGALCDGKHGLSVKALCHLQWQSCVLGHTQAVAFRLSAHLDKLNISCRPRISSSEQPPETHILQVVPGTAPWLLYRLAIGAATQCLQQPTTCLPCRMVPWAGDTLVVDNMPDANMETPLATPTTASELAGAASGAPCHS